MPRTPVLFALLTAGTAPATPESPTTAELNDALRPLRMEAVLWPSPPQFLLRNLVAEDAPLSRAIQAISSEEARKALIQAATKGRAEPEATAVLEQAGWLERTPNGTRPSPRALVQFDEFIESLGGPYRRCKICQLLALNNDSHPECLTTLE